MKRLSTLMLALVVIGAMTVKTSAQTKKVLLEQHTAAWCGWCPDGTAIVDEILALHGDRIIAVKIHGGDAMAIPEQSAIASALGLEGYPSASIDRKKFGGSVFQSRGAWKSRCESQLRQTAKAQVDCFYTLDRQTRTVRIQVMTNIIEPMDFPLRFNAFIVEDDVTGHGSGYDQANFLSGRPGYETNPYYSQPSTIVGYHHMNVVRKMMGGPWGVAVDIPDSVQAGEFYCQQLESKIDERWDINNLYFVGLLQADAEDDKELINCAMAIEDVLLLDSNSPTLRALPSGSDCNNTYTLENATDEEQTYTVTVLTTPRTPADWSAEFTCGATHVATSDSDQSSGQIVVSANSSVELSLTLRAGTTLGLGDAKIILELDGMPAIKRSRMISGISAEIEKVLLESGSEYSLQPYLNEGSHSDIIRLKPSDFLALADEMTNLKLAIWNKGPTDSLSPDEIDLIKNRSNVSHFICGDSVIWGLRSGNHLGFFGLEYIGWSLEGQTSNGSIRISGQAGDVITGSLGRNIRGRLIQYLIDLVKITDTANVSPIMHFQNNGYRQNGNSISSIQAEDAIFGIRTTRNNSRMVLLGMSPYVINSTNTRQTLINNILNWLVVDARTDGFEDSETADGFFEGFETNDFSRFPWRHSGDASWDTTQQQSHTGDYCAKSGSIDHDERTTLEVTLDCTSGDITFYCRVSSESGCDHLLFYIDGVKQGEWSGEQDWIWESYQVNEGTRTFAWTYSKDDSDSDGNDTAWIDDIVFPGR
ncbi:MAG: Omp28-related outer membrane protein [Phycisphaerales bacterium]|nr:MAG: Omp28-related outer membrane protein [Phycisphaerales bacterium]